MNDDTNNLISSTESFVKKELSKNDASHDWEHINRVRTVALSLLREEVGALQQTDPPLFQYYTEIVELSSLLHDIADWKYSGSDTAGVELAAKFLRSKNYPEDKIKEVCRIIEGVGFKKELNTINYQASQANAVPSASDLLLGVVQDGDRLDAIGALGIARCFTFGGHKGRPLYDPAQTVRTNLTSSEYGSSSITSPSINHFYEKLLKLKDLMKTKAGKKRAEQRHQFMIMYLEQFHNEVQGIA